MPDSVHGAHVPPPPDPVRLTGRELGGEDAPTDALRAAALGDGADAVVYRVRLIVRETNEGYCFYDHDLSAAAPAAGL